MKTKLILNVDDKILDGYSKEDLEQNKESTEPSLLERIRKYTYPIEISDEENERLKEEYMHEKYGL